jgi:hypothetical protein
MSDSPVPRHRGAQPGNTNTLKHGYYSAQFKPAEIKDLPTDPAACADLNPEIELLRVFLHRTIQRVNAEKDITLDAQLRALAILSDAAARLGRLVALQQVVARRVPRPVDPNHEAHFREFSNAIDRALGLPPHFTPPRDNSQPAPTSIQRSADDSFPIVPEQKTNTSTRSPSPPPIFFTDH